MIEIDALEPGVGETGRGEVLDHAVKSIGGKVEDKDVLMKALKEAKVPDTICGPVSFDEFGDRKSVV